MVAGDSQPPGIPSSPFSPAHSSPPPFLPPFTLSGVFCRADCPRLSPAGAKDCCGREQPLHSGGQGQLVPSSACASAALQAGSERLWCELQESRGEAEASGDTP